MDKLYLFKAVFKKNLIELRRYLFNTLSGLVTVYIIFLLIFFGAQAFIGGQPRFGNTLSGIVVGFFLWTFALNAYNEPSRALIQEAQWGTLEQLYMSPVGLGWVVLFQMISSFLVTLVFSMSFLFIMMATTGRFLHLDLLSIIPLILITLGAVYGVGFIMGGLALVFKRIESSFQILQFVFIALVMVPPQEFPLLKYLPLSFGAMLIRKTMIEGLSITGLPLGDLIFLIINSVLYFLLGLAGFKYMERIARRRGLLGHY